MALKYFSLKTWLFAMTVTLPFTTGATVKRSQWQEAAARFPCPTTAANGATPPGQAPGASYYGNGKLWTVLWPKGTVVIRPQDVQPDGSLGMKFPWWRGPGVGGKLVIHGWRLDRQAPPLRADIPDGYGLTGFQASGILFPTAGCWQVTGRAGKSTLTFITRVVKRRHWCLLNKMGVQLRKVDDLIGLDNRRERTYPLSR